MFNTFNRAVVKLARSYSNIMFMQSTGAGVVLLLGTFIVPHVGALGLLAGILAMGIAPVLLKIKSFELDQSYIFNAILTGLIIGYFTGSNPLNLLMLAAFIPLTLIMTFLLKSVFDPRGIPVMSLPFSIVGSLCVATTRGLNLLNPTYYYQPLLSVDTSHWPEALVRFCNFLGLVVLSPSMVSGVIFFGVILWKSRLLAIFAVYGHVMGLLLDQLVWHGQVPLASAGLSFNLILISMSLGCGLTVPSLASLSLATMGTMIVYFLNYAIGHMIQRFDVPLPFNVVSLAIYYCLKLAKSPLIPQFYGKTPEETYWTNASLGLGGNIPDRPVLGLPFKDSCTVYQGFSGAWTHKAPWQHALDFVIRDEYGKTFKGDGCDLSDFYCYKMPVYAPCAGYVIETHNLARDHNPGDVNKEQNWGNYVLLGSQRGYYVLLCHLAEKSISVSVGDWVEEGQFLGACGNTGYSPEPHVHMQVQAEPKIGSPTIEFCISTYEASFENSNQISFHAIPQKDQTIASPKTNVGLTKIFSFILDQTLTFQSQSNDHHHHTFRVGMDAYSGVFFFEDISTSKSNAARLYFVKNGSVFYFTSFWGDAKSPLRCLFACLPCLPLSFGSKKSWTARLPLPIRYRGIALAVATILEVFGLRRKHARSSFYSDPSGMIIEGKTYLDNQACTSKVVIDPISGIEMFQCGGVHFKRVTDNLLLGEKPYEFHDKAA